MTKHSKPHASKAPVRSVRVEDDLWAAAKARADYEDVTMSHVLYTFVKGYADGQINLPQVIMKFDSPRQPVA